MIQFTINSDVQADSFCGFIFIIIVLTLPIRCSTNFIVPHSVSILYTYSLIVPFLIHYKLENEL